MGWPFSQAAHTDFGKPSPCRDDTESARYRTCAPVYPDIGALPFSLLSPFRFVAGTPFLAGKGILVNVARRDPDFNPGVQYDGVFPLSGSHRQTYCPVPRLAASGCCGWRKSSNPESSHVEGGGGAPRCGLRNTPGGFAQANVTVSCTEGRGRAL